MNDEKVKQLEAKVDRLQEAFFDMTKAYGRLQDAVMEYSDKQFKREIAEILGNKTVSRVLYIEPDLFVNRATINLGGVERMVAEAVLLQGLKFNNEPDKLWCWDEIYEAAGEELPQDGWKIVNEAVRRINDKVAKQTGVQKFLLVPKNTRSVRFNTTNLEDNDQ